MNLIQPATIWVSSYHYQNPAEPWPDPCGQRGWAPSTAMPNQSCVLVFNTVHQLEHLKIAMAGSDVTTDGNAMSLHWRNAKGMWQPLMSWEDTNINRGKENMTNMEPHQPFKQMAQTIPSVDTALEQQLASAVMFRFDGGHGWWALQGLQLFGTSTGEAARPLPLFGGLTLPA